MKKSLIAAGAASVALAAMPVLGTFADVIDTVEITISSACGVASTTAGDPATETTNATFEKDMTNGSYWEWAPASGTGGSLYVACNDTSGWNVTAQGYSGETAGTTTMIPSSTGTAIPTGTTLDGTASAWAFKVADGDTGATMVTAYSNAYAQIPAAATRVAYKANAQGNPSMISDGLIYTGYKVSVSPTQEADTYTGKVKYVVSAGVGNGS